MNNSNFLSAQTIYQLICVAHKAGKAAIDVRKEAELNKNSQVNTRIKSDKSVVTDADIAAEKIILEGLKHFADIAVISEEQYSFGIKANIGAMEQFFLVDPVDGTKEFVRGGDDFTVNIGLIKKQKTVWGIVYAPATGEMFWVDTQGRCCLADIPTNQEIPNISVLSEITRILQVRKVSQEITAIASRSHKQSKTDTFLHKIGISGYQPVGSSIKFCRLAQGKADVYPRFGRTMLWDTAAGQAILNAAGGITVDFSGNELTYDIARAELDNPNFIAIGDNSLLSKILPAAKNML